MKKFTILTSVLALAACGGGSGGGSGVAPVPAPVSLNTDIAVSLDQMDFRTADDSVLKFNMSNGNVVSVTEINEDGDMLTYANIGNNKFQKTNYVVYDSSIHSDDIRDALKDDYGIDYEGPISTGFSSETELNDKQKLELLISKNIKLLEENDIEITDEVKNIVKTLIGTPTWETYAVHSDTMTIESMGKDLELAYSDFGTITSEYSFNDNKNLKEYSFYVAGSKDNVVNKPNTDMNFTGAAIASISQFDSDDEAMLSKTNKANLELSGSKEILTMDFTEADNPWYKVEITKEGNNSFAKIDINDDANAKIKRDDLKATSEMINQWTDYEDPLNIKYYGGADNVATEITATSRFGLADENYENGIHVNAAFVGKAE